jgi:XTP/dITP diphosphohydrolase
VRLLLATRNVGKLAELDALLRPLGHDLVDLNTAGIPVAEADEEAIEQWETFEENALAKARYFFARAGGVPVVADDSGLEVRVLGGRPGVRSKRFSGRTELDGRALDAANNERLVAELANTEDRTARFVCAAAFVSNSSALAVRGEVAGTILRSPRGAGGFGYDPYFYATELGQTFGEASIDEKERVSHRARAFRALVARVPSLCAPAH